jgi:hypothetical protein
VLCVLPFSGLGITRLAYAQSETELILKARLGFDGYCQENSWLPVHVEIQNTGPDLDAAVQVSYDNDRGGKTATSMDVLLPTRSRKEFFLYIYPQARTGSMSVSLIAKGRTLKKIDLRATCLAGDNRLFGVIANDPSAYDVLNDVKPLHGFVRVAQLTISDLPASPQAWSSLDALIVSNVDTGRLTPEQQQALKLWLGAGGKLLIIGGSKWQGTAAGLKDFLPIDIDTTSTVNGLPELQAYTRDPVPLEAETVLATGKLLKGADTLVEQDGLPVIVQKQMGAGTVYYLAADPALRPLSQWNGMQDLYDHLLGFEASSPAWTDEQSLTYYDASQALATIPELGLPSIFYICGLLFFYIIVIGPVNYFVLRRMKKRELAWISIPVLVVIFTGLSYSTGLLYRGTTPILNRLAVVQAWDGVDRAHVRALVGIYSPVRAKYDLEAGKNFMIAPTGGGDTNLQANNDWTALLQDTSMVMPDVRVEIGEMKAVAFEGSLPALEISHDLVLTTDRITPMLSGNVTNKSAYTLRDAFIVTSGQWTRLGDIAPGKTRAVNVSVANGSSGPAFYSLNAMDILNASYPALETDKDLARRNALLQALLGFEYGINQGNWGIYLMGWVDDAVLPISLQDQKSKTIDTTLYIDSLSPSVEIGRDELTLPASLFAWEASEPNVSPYYISGIPTGGYTLRFKPAFPVRFREIKSLRFVFSSNAAPGEIIASAWNYKEKTWDPIQLMGGHTTIPEPDRYVGPDNEIRIKVISNRSDWTEITASHVTLVVQP